MRSLPRSASNSPLVSAVPAVGSHLSPYRRFTSDVPNNILNRFALHSLDNAIAAIEPTSTRIYLSVPAASMDGVVSVPA